MIDSIFKVIRMRSSGKQIHTDTTVKKVVTRQLSAAKHMELAVSDVANNQISTIAYLFQCILVC